MSKEIVYWKQRNGELISIDDMDVNHLRNVLKMIIRNNQKVQATCPHNISDAEALAELEAEYNAEDYGCR